MAILDHINPFSRSNPDTGFGVNASDYGGRFTNKDGSVNLRKTGIPFWQRLSIFNKMLTMPRWKFISLTIVVYIVINLLFTIVYLIVGTDQLAGLKTGSFISKFYDTFFFSTQTFTTVGYGQISPQGFLANCVASLESLSGLLFLAFFTGLIYGRFSRPRAYIAFSDNALISPYRDMTAIMFRLASYKNNHHLTDARVEVTLSMVVNENGKMTNKFFPLKLERTKVNSLAMNWTVVHPIDNESPVLNFTADDFQSARVELIVMMRGFDDVFSTIVQQRTSYTHEELIYGARFLPMYGRSENGRTTILEINKLNAHEKVTLPAVSRNEAPKSEPIS